MGLRDRMWAYAELAYKGHRSAANAQTDLVTRVDLQETIHFLKELVNATDRALAIE